jgi:hypothetical protein
MKLKVGINITFHLEAVPFDTVRRAIALILAQGNCFQRRQVSLVEEHILAGLRQSYTHGALFDFGTIPMDAAQLHTNADKAWSEHALVHPYPQWAMVVRAPDAKGATLTHLLAINCAPVTHSMIPLRPNEPQHNKVFSMGIWGVSSKVTTFMGAAEVTLNPPDGSRPVVHATINDRDDRRYGEGAIIGALDLIMMGMYLLSQPRVPRNRISMPGSSGRHASGQHRTYTLLNSEPYVTRLAFGPSLANTTHVGHGHGSPSPHDRRGHTRTLRSGKVVQVRPAKVGYGVTRRRHYEAEVTQ